VASGDGYLSISNLQRDAYGYYSYHVDVEPKEHIIYFGEERIKEVRASGDVYTSEYEPGEIEITWDTAYADKVFYQIFGGAYYDDATLVGIIGEIILSLTPMDVVCDFRDMCAYITKICKGQHSLENYGMAFVCFASIFVITADAFSIWKKVKKLNQTEVNILMASTKLDGITEESIETGIKHVGEVLEGGSGNVAYHSVGGNNSANKIQSVLNGIDISYTNPQSRFGQGFYVAADGKTTVAELSYHGTDARYSIRYDINLNNQKVLDLTNPQVAKEWGYIQGESSLFECQNIAEAAVEDGYTVIKVQSYRRDGINYVIYDNFDEILHPQMVTPIGE